MSAVTRKENTDITFKAALNKLGMLDEPSSGLRFVSTRASEREPSLFLALEAAVTFGATAVYFRFYNDDRPPKPQVYIYDESGSRLSDYQEADIHHKLWNAGIVPFCFVFKNSSILVYSCGRKPKWDDEGENFITQPHDVINLLSDVHNRLELYNARQFDSGLFWDSREGKQFKYEEGAYEQLLVQLKNVKSVIISRLGNDNAPLVKRVLMMLILIKYLEERKDEDGKGALDPGEFYKSCNIQNPSLEGVLDNAETFAAVLTELSSKEHFNGQIFSLTGDELLVLKKMDLNLFRYFVRGDVSIFSKGSQSIGQMTLWRLYQFNYLPIELISHIYEDFLADENGQKKKGVVYTPPYLVQFLIDQCMPLNIPKKDFKILDPACGSGIFLVGAFKRMIQWWRLENHWRRPAKENIDELKNLLHHNIFGCDLEDEAVILSYFSVGLALLDSLSPKEIWRNVHFDNLIETNLFQGDFFKTIQEDKLESDFDLVIGNPPFDSQLTEWAKQIDRQERNLNSLRPDVPDNQIALLFLEQSFKLLKNGGNCCLILPSGPVLYNTNTHSFRRYLLEQNYFKGIYDFTPLRTKLFIGSSSSAKPAVAAILAEKSDPDKKSTSHYIFRRTKSSGEKIDFEIDHYDIHTVSWNTAKRNAGVWQANFMGGGRLYQLLEKVSDSQTFGQYLDKKIEHNNWKVGEGWTESPDADPLRQLYILENKASWSKRENDEFLTLKNKYAADWITGYDYIETEDFPDNKNLKTSVCQVKYFYRSSKKNKEIFQPPHLLIKENVTGKAIPVFLSHEYLTFKHKILGIHAPQKDISQLRQLEKDLKNNVCLPLMWLLSGQVLTSREGVPLKGDILNLPYPLSQFDELEKILLNDIQIYYSDFRKAGENSIVLTPVSPEDLQTFGELYCRILNSIYGTFKPLPPIIGKEFIAYPFVLGKHPEIDIPSSIREVEAQLKSLINSKQGHNLWIRRIVKVYHKNVIFFYKPNQKRYWLSSIAIRDADETFLDLYKQGK